MAYLISTIVIRVIECLAIRLTSQKDAFRLSRASREKTPGSTGTTTWSDANCWQDLEQCHFHIGATLDLPYNVRLLYNAANDKLWMLSDDGTTWLGGFAPGTVDFLENSQARVSCAQTSVHGYGDTIEVRWAIAFKSDFEGAKNTYLMCQDVHGAACEWEQKGTWTIAAT